MKEGQPIAQGLRSQIAAYLANQKTEPQTRINAHASMSLSGSRPDSQPHLLAHASNTRQARNQQAALENNVRQVQPPRVLRQPNENTQENTERRKRQETLHRVNRPSHAIHLRLQKQQSHPSPLRNIRKIIHNQRQTDQHENPPHVKPHIPNVDHKQTQNRNRQENERRPHDHKPIHEMMKPQPAHLHLAKTRNRKEIQHRSQNRCPQKISTQNKRLPKPPMSRIKHHQEPNRQQDAQKTIKSQNPTNRLLTISPHRTNHNPHPTPQADNDLPNPQPLNFRSQIHNRPL